MYCVCFQKVFVGGPREDVLRLGVDLGEIVNKFFLLHIIIKIFFRGFRFIHYGYITNYNYWYPLNEEKIRFRIFYR